ncbi:MAG: site-specific DNA-methyltransferase [Anaerolineales bacterium]|nr:site-specific DNA-methyltransferase [Anaerolineales bacterium]MBX3036868.1 site-specific DNA-methyltransferase [Anaerolineales bacterium]
MASGLSKTKWHDTSLPTFNLPIADTSIDVDLSYQGKKSIPEILSTKKSNISLTWQGKTTTNRLYYGNNLSILANLLEDEKIRGKVQLIYIDPPYATKGVFQTRSQKDAYSDLLEGSHYIEFLRERLIILRELLAPNGSIYVHLDENMAFYIKVIMDEVFGKNNFRNWITRKKCNPKNYTRKTYGDISDYILFYTKSDEYVWNRAYDKWTDEKALKEYSYVEEGTGRRYKKVPIHAPGTRNGETGKMWRGMMPPTGKHWQYTPETLDAMDARGEIFWSSNGNPRRKVYLDESEGIPAQDIWLDYKDAHNQNIEITGYPTEKNPNLLKRIIEASSNADDLVLDCFSGSGTTLEVASQLNRKWIGIDNSHEAIKTTLNRFANGTEPMGDYVGKKTKTKSMPLFRITDFELYSETERNKELDELVKQWREWIADS